MRGIWGALVLLWAIPAAAEATFTGSYIWVSNDPLFGGFSGIELSENGLHLTALSDRGAFITAVLTRTDGVITDITPGAIIPMTDTGGQLDSEGLAISPDGQIFVSFEGQHGVQQFAGLNGRSVSLPVAPYFANMQHNSSLEALAIGPDGALYTLPERSGRATRPFPVYRLRDGHWDRPFDVPRRGAFLMSGADIGPDGLLYLLERDFNGIGFRTRVRRFDLHGGSEETILQTGSLTHDNLEGISVWVDDKGLRLTMIADDNFRMFQRTEIIEYRIND